MNIRIRTATRRLRRLAPRTRGAVAATAALAAVTGTALALSTTDLHHQAGVDIATRTVADATASGTVLAADALTVRAYTPAAGQPSTQLPATGTTLTSPAKVTIACYYIGQPVAGPAALGGPTDYYWDQLTGSIAPHLPSGAVPVVADAWIHTDQPVNTIVPACTGQPSVQKPIPLTAFSNNTLTWPGSSTASQSHDPGMPGPGGVLNGPPTLMATAVGTSNPFRMVTEPAGITLCYVGSRMVPCTAPNPTNPSPETYISAIVKYAAQTGIDPRLILTILWNEQNHMHALGGDAVNGIYDWITHKTDGPSYGLADMKQDTFNQVKAAHPTLFGQYQWTDLQTNNDLAIQTLAWKLYDITGPVGTDILPSHWNTGFKRDEMLAMAYNQGAGNAITYAHGGPLDSQVRTNLSNYKAGIDQNWNQADQIICQSGAFTCSR